MLAFKQNDSKVQVSFLDGPGTSFQFFARVISRRWLILPDEAQKLFFGAEEFFGVDILRNVCGLILFVLLFFVHIES